LSLTGSAPNRGQQQFDKGSNGNHGAASIQVQCAVMQVKIQGVYESEATVPATPTTTPRMINMPLTSFSLHESLGPNSLR
jgi:hypothetical protein